MTIILQVYKSVSNMDETVNLHWLGENSRIPSSTKLIGQVKDILISSHHRSWAFFPCTAKGLNFGAHRGESVFGPASFHAGHVAVRVSFCFTLGEGLFLFLLLLSLILCSLGFVHCLFFASPLSALLKIPGRSLFLFRRKCLFFSTSLSIFLKI